jgi:hypothetical protein
VNAVSAWWQPWTAVAGFAFLLNFVWEMWQVPFYRTIVAASHLDAVVVCNAPLMPTVFGIGLTPLIQWLVLPPVALWLAARHLGAGKMSGSGAPGRLGK